MADHPSIPGQDRFRSSEFKRLISLVSAQFPGDEQTVLIYVERACRAVADGRVSVEDLLEQVAAYGA
jgi:hypothetical protein